MRICLFVLGILVWAQTVAADCEVERRIEKTLGLSDARSVSIIAAAGDLRVVGVEDLDEARIEGVVCASRQDWAEEADIAIRAGDEAEIAVNLPEVDWGVSWSGGRYVYMDVEIEVPAEIAVYIRDSSGDMHVSGTADLDITDSSGTIEVTDIHGALSLKDSSGDIEIERVDGDVVVEHDSSGDIDGRVIGGSVLVKKDSSGDIRFREVRSNYTVERDSSGDIVADTVGGDFRVLKDGSGRIRATNVEGAVETPEKG